ncbi:hypothetical protein Ato02nite_028360 [Paractinoplanes toevensis]|uniref:GntR C-terminal domain-containing protein n=1 Tax=Paractinoplanes toevensis TaxID=571911 RepID=A0A919T8F4_9ACTN|nr:hypothetical protein Ato02nite_028360 [Actinoplanes toevensis]
MLVQFAQRTNISHWIFSGTGAMSPADAVAVNAEHRQMIEALRRHDGDATEALVRAHIGRTLKILEQAAPAL